MFILQNTLEIMKRDKMRTLEQGLIGAGQSFRYFLGNIHETTGEIAVHNGIRKAVQDYGHLDSSLKEKIDHFIQQQFQVAKDKSPYLQQLLIVSRGGEVFSYEESYSIDSQEFFKSPYFKSVNNKKDEVLWAYEVPPSFFAKSLDEKVLFTLQGIKGLESDDNVGYLVSMVNTQSMDELYQDMLSGLPGELSIYDSSNHSFILPPNYPIDEKTIQDFIQKEAFYKMKELKVKGKTYAVGVAPLGPLNWYTTSVVPLEEVVANIKDIYKKEIGVYAILGLFIVAWMIFLVLFLTKVVKIKQEERSKDAIEKIKNKELIQHREEDLQHLKDTEILVERKDLGKIREYIHFWRKELLEKEREEEKDE